MRFVEATQPQPSPGHARREGHRQRRDQREREVVRRRRGRRSLARRRSQGWRVQPGAEGAQQLFKARALEAEVFVAAAPVKQRESGRRRALRKPARRCCCRHAGHGRQRGANTAHGTRCLNASGRNARESGARALPKRRGALLRERGGADLSSARLLALLTLERGAFRHSWHESPRRRTLRRQESRASRSQARSPLASPLAT